MKSYGNGTEHISKFVLGLFCNLVLRRSVRLVSWQTIASDRESATRAFTRLR